MSETVTTRRTPLQIADIIISDPRIDLSAMHTLIDSPTHDDTVSVNRSHSISAPSIELDGVTVHVSMLVIDPSYWGTFDRTVGTRMVRIIHARSTTDAEHGGPPPPVRLPLREQIGWVRAALGQAFDYTYRLMNERTLLRIRSAFFLVFLDGTHGRLAPSDLDWAQVCGGRRAYAEKLVPDDRALLNRMVRDGDVLDASLTTHHSPLTHTRRNPWPRGRTNSYPTSPPPSPITSDASETTDGSPSRRYVWTGRHAWSSATPST